jgi:DNA invertase Pin-like site-specific DNA recombinase
VSAYRGKNAKEGALWAFLDAIEHNLVPPNSFLLIESLDRLSRDRILSAQALFLQILQAGVTIVTLVDQRSYSLESLNQSQLDLIISLVSMMRANEESEPYRGAPRTLGAGDVAEIIIRNSKDAVGEGDSSLPRAAWDQIK